MTTGAGCDVTRGAITKRGVSSAITHTKQQQEQGFEPEASGAVILTKTEVATLGLAHQIRFTIDGKAVFVTAILRDEVDPMCEVQFRHIP